MVFTVVVKVCACSFGNRKPLLNAAIWKEGGMMIDFHFPVASVLFWFFKQEAIVLWSYVCSVGTQNSPLKFGKDRGAIFWTNFNLFLQFRMKYRSRDHTT